MAGLWYNGGMTPNTQSKSILSRLLANENIVVVHNAKARTAMFDVRNRVLTLPVLDSMSDELYDMIVAHEVGHALYTPYTEEDEKNLYEDKPMACAFKISEEYPRLAMGYLNIIEDARIEKLMKEKFPGLRRDFYIGYGELHERDFFDARTKNLNEMSFIDRINLHYKVGTHVQNYVSFNEEEMKFIHEIDNARTFDEVIDITKRIWEYAIAKENPTNGEYNPDGNSPYGDDGNGSENGIEEGSEKKGIGKQGGLGYSNRGLKPHECSTMTAYQKKFDNTLISSINGYSYLNIPHLTKNPIDDYKKIMSAYEVNSKKCPDEYAMAENEFKDFQNKSKNVVNILVKQFLAKKAAKDSIRGTTSKSGIIDPVRMMNYNFTDDIFLRLKVVKKGKSHGLVFIMDWSGSMSVSFGDTMRQLFQLVLFCRRLNIPFEVYGFTSVSDRQDRFDDTVELPNIWEYDSNAISYSKQPSDTFFEQFRMMNILSSRMSGKEFNTMMRNLFVQILMYQGKFTNRVNYYDIIPHTMELGSTPLNEAILSGIDIVNQFRANNRLDIVHTFFLTDGEGFSPNIHPTGPYHKANVVYKNKIYPVAENKDLTDTIMEIFRDRTGSRAIGIFLECRRKNGLSMNTIQSYFGSFSVDVAKINKEYDDNGFICTPHNYHGYSEHFIIAGNSEIEDDDLDEVLADRKSNTGIRNAFIKTMESRITSRILLNRFIDLIAVE